MGYAFYTIDGMDRGYGVPDVCHQEGCDKKIDRGMSYLCNKCLLYFCGDHLTVAWCTRADEAIEIESFAGQTSEVCQKCKRELEEFEMKNCEHEDKYE